MTFWNKKIINFEDEYFGLDLSELSAKVFQLEKKGGLDRVRSFNIEPIREGFIKDGKIIEKAKLGEFIAGLIKKTRPKKIQTKKVICSISESKVFLRILAIPAVSIDEAREAVKWEIEASIPLSVDQVYYDWCFLDKIDGKQNILTVAVAKETVDDLVDVLESAGLSVFGLEMDSIATVRSLIPKNSKRENIYLIVDMGEEKTSFIITEGCVPYFTSSIPFSSSGITEQISSTMGVSKEEAEKIKIEQGIERGVNHSAVFNSVKPLLENLSVEVEKTIDFYSGISKKTNQINGIIISGGGANLKGLVPYFATRLSMEVILGNPWINLNMGKNLPPISRSDSVRYATSIGLAI